MTRFTLKPLVLIAALTAANLAWGQDRLQPGETEGGIKLKLSAYAEGGRDLGRSDASTGERIDIDEETAEGFADIQGQLYWQMSEHWASFGRIQGFVPSGEVVVYDEEDPRSTESYAALRELWLQYDGFTSYPGEYVRFGRQRLRERDGSWWDRDIESVRWMFDTTLLQWHVAIAEQFHTFRTGETELPASQRDRAYLLGGLSQQWKASHFYGLRAAHAFDHTDLAEEDSRHPENPKRADRRFTWLGINAHNGYHLMPEFAGLYYWAELAYLLGNTERYTPEVPATPPTPPPFPGFPGDPGDPGSPAMITDSDVRAWAGDFGLRFRFDVPFSVGVAYAFGQGGEDGDTSNTFEQTGLHSNRSRFTGTRSLIYRFNEALQPELSNLRVVSAFMSVPGERYDASLVFHHFSRDDGNVGVETDGLDVQPINNEANLGYGYDLVLTGYFGTQAPQELGDREDLRSNLRLRGSVFEPGDAYGDDLDAQYRAMLELTLWF